MTAWLIEPLVSPSEIDAILAIEEASFTNPWTREMYLAELQNEGVSFFYLARDPERQTIGFCSVWRVLGELHINNPAVLAAHRRGGGGAAVLAHALQAEARRSSEQLVFRFFGIRQAYSGNPVETRSCCGARSWRNLDTTPFRSGAV